jgi:Uncharacterized protein containing a von Willebrand factor type A (vWA) domain
MVFLPKRFVALLLLSIAMLATNSFGQKEEDTVISVDSTTVVMNATIVDKNGSHVAGLKKEQFSIFEDGIQQQIDFFQAEETPFAAVILLDSSGSMEQRVSLARAAAIKFLDGLRPTDSAAIYRFDSKVNLVQDFSNSRDVTEKIFDVKSYGMTVLNDAVYKAAIELAKRPEKRRAIIVLSDGADTMSGRSADAALKAALAANAVIYTVDMTSPEASLKQKMESSSTLKKFAEKSGGTFVATPGGVAMREAFEKIVAELGVQYTLGFSPSNLKQDGKWRALEMRIARPNLSIRTRKGYNAAKVK